MQEAGAFAVVLECVPPKLAALISRKLDIITIGMGAGAEARRPLGLAVVGGLCFSQLVTLYITPVYYAYMEDFSRWLTRRFGQRFEANRATRAEHEKEEGSHAG